uniref:Uncharacterized protein n=1 Tax=Oryza barthii TaxID=65489 RepID=A0A0D3F8X8_9ORYZ
MPVATKLTGAVDWRAHWKPPKPLSSSSCGRSSVGVGASGSGDGQAGGGGQELVGDERRAAERAAAVSNRTTGRASSMAIGGIALNSGRRCWSADDDAQPSAIPPPRPCSIRSCSVAARPGGLSMRSPRPTAWKAQRRKRWRWPRRRSTWSSSLGRSSSE